MGLLVGDLQTFQVRRQDRPHRPRIDRTVGMAADMFVDDAVVHARATANAAQHLFHAFREHPCAAVVDQNDVIFLRPVGILVPFRPIVERNVLGYFPARCRTGQQSQQWNRVRHGRHQFLDTCRDDVYFGWRRGEFGIAFISDGAG